MTRPVKNGGGAIEVTPVPSEQAAVLRRLLSEYLREFAAAEGTEVETGPDGEPSYEWFEAYWAERERVPVGFWHGGELVGFCLLRDDAEAWEVAEFFVHPAHRRRGFGTAAVAQLTALCRSLGGHTELRAKVHHWNSGGLSFWTRQGFEARSNDDEGVVTVRVL